MERIRPIFKEEHQQNSIQPRLVFPDLKTESGNNDS